MSSRLHDQTSPAGDILGILEDASMLYNEDILVFVLSLFFPRIISSKLHVIFLIPIPWRLCGLLYNDRQRSECTQVICRTLVNRKLYMYLPLLVSFSTSTLAVAYFDISDTLTASYNHQVCNCFTTRPQKQSCRPTHPNTRGP